MPRVPEVKRIKEFVKDFPVSVRFHKRVRYFNSGSRNYVEIKSKNGHEFGQALATRLSDCLPGLLLVDDNTYSARVSHSRVVEYFAEKDKV